MREPHTNNEKLPYRELYGSFSYMGAMIGRATLYGKIPYKLLYGFKAMFYMVVFSHIENYMDRLHGFPKWVYVKSPI